MARTRVATSESPVAVGRAARRAARVAAPRICLLGNGELEVGLSAYGTGFSRYQGAALTRWANDPVEDRDGAFLYLRDRDDRAVWSAAWEPIPSVSERYRATSHPGRFEIVRHEHEIESRLEVWVASRRPLEIRRLTLTNHSRRPRRLDLTSYAEVVLLPPAADAAHPAFSKLFVQTE